MKKFENIKNHIKASIEKNKNIMRVNLKKLKNNIETSLKKLKNFIKENIFTIILWSQFILTITLTIAVICSLNTVNNLSKQLDDISNKVTSSTSSTPSQDSTESDISSEAEPETDDTPISSIPSGSIPPSSMESSSATSSSTESTPPTVTTGTTTELDMLACVIYQEVGGNMHCDECRRRVADVVLNRVADPRFPDTIKEVLTAKGQYGRLYWTGIKWPSRSKNYYEQDAVARAYRIAEEVLNGNHSALYGDGYVYQAGFKQGTTQIYCCGHYFGK